MWLLIIACAAVLIIGIIEKGGIRRISMPCQYASILMVSAESQP